MKQAHAAVWICELLLITAICSSTQHLPSAAVGPTAAHSRSLQTQPALQLSPQSSRPTRTNTCPPGCYNDPTSSCPNRGCTVRGSAGKTALCCTSQYMQRFRIQVQGAGQCNAELTQTVTQFVRRAMDGLNTAMARSGSVVNILDVDAVCEKGVAAAIATPAYFKDKGTYSIVLNITYRGTRHVRDVITYGHKLAGPCGGMFLGLCSAVYTQQSKQSCLYDRLGSTYSCDWLAQRSRPNQPGTSPPPSPPPSSPGTPRPSPGPNPSPRPNPPSSPDPSPSPDPDNGNNDPKPQVHPDQAILLETKAVLTAGDRTLLSDWRAGSNMCDDYWEGIWCYFSGPYKGAVQEITLDYGALTGRLPLPWFNLTAPMVINLEGNELSGSLPSSWQSLGKVTTLRLAGNKFSGSIPAEWGSGMTALEYLSVHSNPQLSGCIPNAFSSRSFYLYDSTDEPGSVGVGGEFANQMMNGTGSSVLENTAMTGWCP